MSIDVKEKLFSKTLLIQAIKGYLFFSHLKKSLGLKFLIWLDSSETPKTIAYTFH